MQNALASAARAELTTVGKKEHTDEEVGLMTGMTAQQVGDLATRDGLRVHELSPITESLEDAFMKLTHDEVEYRPSSLVGPVGAGERN